MFIMGNFRCFQNLCFICVYSKNVCIYIYIDVDQYGFVYRYNSTCQSIQWTRVQLVVESFSWKNAPIENIAPQKKTWNMWTKTTPRSFHFGGDSWFIFGMGLWPRPWQHWEKHHLEDNSVTNRFAISEPSNLGLLSRSFPFRFHPHTEYPSSVPYGIFTIFFLCPYFPSTRIPAFYKQYNFFFHESGSDRKKIAVAN